MKDKEKVHKIPVYIPQLNFTMINVITSYESRGGGKKIMNEFLI